MRKTAILKDIHEVASHPFPFIHPEEVSAFETVHQYSAVMGEDQQLVNSLDYITCKKDVSGMKLQG